MRQVILFTYLIMLLYTASSSLEIVLTDREYEEGGIDLEDGTKTGGGVLIILAGETGRRDYLTFGDIIKRAVS